MTYVGYPAQIFSGTIADNLFFGLRNRPLRPRNLRRRGRGVQAGHPGGQAFGQPAVRQRGRLDRLRERWAERPRGGGAGGGAALAMVRLDRDVYHMGLRGTIDPEAQPEVAAAVLGRAAPCASGSRIRASAAWSRCSTRTLQRQRDARREPAVRRAGRRDLRHRASRRPSLRPADPRARRPDRHAGRGRPQGGRHDGRAVRRPAARSRVFPAVQLHRRRRSARVSRADHPGRSGTGSTRSVARIGSA